MLFPFNPEIALIARHIWMSVVSHHFTLSSPKIFFYIFGKFRFIYYRNFVLYMGIKLYFFPYVYMCFILYISVSLYILPFRFIYGRLGLQKTFEITFVKYTLYTEKTYSKNQHLVNSRFERLKTRQQFCGKDALYLGTPY